MAKELVNKNDFKSISDFTGLIVFARFVVDLQYDFGDFQQLVLIKALLSLILFYALYKWLSVKYVKISEWQFLVIALTFFSYVPAFVFLYYAWRDSRLITKIKSMSVLDLLLLPVLFVLLGWLVLYYIFR